MKYGIESIEWIYLKYKLCRMQKFETQAIRT